MKVLSLDNYISEKKSISPLTVKQIKELDIKLYNYQPETKDELREIIYKRMKDEGNECNLNDIDVSNITDMSCLFSYTDIQGKFIRKNNISDFNGDISEWNVSNVEDMSYMFCGDIFFDSDISEWDVSNVKNMYGMFYNAVCFNSNISKWDVSNVEDMSYMFCVAKSFNGNISKWDVSNVKDMSYMFYGAESFNCDISKWNVSNVEHMGMFFECPLRNYPEKQPEF